MDNFFNTFYEYLLKSVPQKSVKLMTCYADFVKLGIKAAYNKQIKTEIKLKKFDLLYKQIFKHCALKNTIISTLQNEFVKENISLSLLSDMVKAFKQLSKYNDRNNWDSKLYCYQLFCSPLARMIMVLNDLNVSVYIPLNSLIMCSVLVSDVINDSTKNRRMYLSKIAGLLKDAQILPLIIKNKYFRFKVWYFVILLNIFTNKFAKKQPLKLSRFDFGKILFYACIKWLFTRVRTLKFKGV